MSKNVAIQQVTLACNLNIYFIKFIRHNALWLRGKYKVRSRPLHGGPIGHLSLRTHRRILKGLHMEVIAVTSDRIRDDETSACHLGEAFVMRLVSLLALMLHSQKLYRFTSCISFLRQATWRWHQERTQQSSNTSRRWSLDLPWPYWRSGSFRF